MMRNRVYGAGLKNKRGISANFIMNLQDLDGEQMEFDKCAKTYESIVCVNL